MKHPITYILALIALFAFFTGTAVADFEGRKKCSSCHKSQAKSWSETAHGNAMESLKAGERKEAKIKAGLDPDKDYTQDKDCVGCHVDGWGQKGGYTVEKPKRMLAAVGCESCHGPGKKYRGDHRKGGQAFERNGRTTERSVLAKKGKTFTLKKRVQPVT